MKKDVIRTGIADITAELLLETGSMKVNIKEPFTLTSGRRSPIYIDCRKLISSTVARNMVNAFAQRLIQGLEVDVISGGETAGIPYGAWLAQSMNLPFVYIRKKPRAHATKSQIEGAIKEGDNVLLYEDLITDGGSKIAFLEGIRNAGGVVRDCLVVFDRLQGGKSLLEGEGVTLHALTDMDKALKVSKNRWSDEEVSSVEDYLKDPIGWMGKYDIV